MRIPGPRLDSVTLRTSIPGSFSIMRTAVLTTSLTASTGLVLALDALAVVFPGFFSLSNSDILATSLVCCLPIRFNVSYRIARVVFHLPPPAQAAITVLFEPPAFAYFCDAAEFATGQIVE